MRGFLTGLVLLLFSLALQADERAVDRSGFGEGPLWTALTDFEQRTLEAFPQAQQGDAEALFALYLLASGEVRTEAGFRQHREQFTDRLEEIDSRVSGVTDERELGRELLDAMHAVYLSGRIAGGDGLLASYDADQSQLSRVLTDGVYNCISSSLLYISLAQRYGLSTRGALLPSHAFVELLLSDGTMVEVETTAEDGFAVERDASQYGEADQEWFEERDLEVPSFQDYLERTIVSSAELGLENMWNQHASPERMSYADRMRLAEIHGHLRPQDHQAQKNRLIFYTREFEFLHEQQDEAALLALFELVGPYLDRMDRLSETREEAAQDSEFRNLLAWNQAARANVLMSGDRPGEGLQIARGQLDTLDEHVTEADRVRNNLYLALDAYAQRRASQRAFSRGREAFDGLETECAGHPACEGALTRLYAAWAQNYWSMSEWSSVVRVYSEYLSLSLDSLEESVLRGNLAAAFVNWANRDWFDEDREQAMAHLQRCVEQLPEAQVCASRLQEMKRVY